MIAAGTTPSTDLKTVILLQEAFRHCKTLGAWGDGAAGLEAAAIPADAPGVVAGDKVGKPFTDELVAALGLHRAWDRAELVMSSAVPPSLGVAGRAGDLLPGPLRGAR